MARPISSLEFIHGTFDKRGSHRIANEAISEPETALRGGKPYRDATRLR